MLVDLSDVLTKFQLANVIYEAAFRNRFNLGATRRAMQRANGRHNLHVLEPAIALYLSGSAGTRSRAGGRLPLTCCSSPASPSRS